MFITGGNLNEYQIAKKLRVDEYLIKLERKIAQIKEDGRRSPD